MKLGAQFFSIRNKTTTTEDLRLSFAKMKEIGYEIAQMSAICKIEPELLKSYSDEYQLPITCTHSPFDRIINDTDALIKEHIIYGCPVIGLGSMPNQYRGSLDGAKEFLKLMENPIKKIQNSGLRFAYHNHAFEFENSENTSIFDFMIEQSPDMNFILDTYWIKYGGRDYLEYIKLLGSADRLTNVHFKDMASEPKGAICPCGNGVIDFRPVITLCDSLGIPNALVEQDNAPQSGDSWGQMQISFNNLKELF